MRLKVIGSSSRGNGYVLDNGKEALVIEAGVPYVDVLREINYMNTHVVGCIVTHEHGDHAKYITQYLRGSFDVFGSSPLHERYKKVIPYTSEQFKLGGFTIRPFKVFHDVECWGFLIHHQDTGTIIFVTDSNGLGGYVLPQLDFILIEANYKGEIIDGNVTDGEVSSAYRDRVVKTHMSLEQVCEILSKSDLTRVKYIALLHLSENNSNEKLFVRTVEELTGIKTFVASAHVNVSIDRRAF